MAAYKPLQLQLPAVAGGSALVLWRRSQPLLPPSRIGGGQRLDHRQLRAPPIPAAASTTAAPDKAASLSSSSDAADSRERLAKLKVCGLWGPGTASACLGMCPTALVGCRSLTLTWCWCRGGCAIVASVQVVDLQEQLVSLGLPKSGRKDDLIDRLLRALDQPSAVRTADGGAASSNGAPAVAGAARTGSGSDGGSQPTLPTPVAATAEGARRRRPQKSSASTASLAEAETAPAPATAPAAPAPARAARSSSSSSTSTTTRGSAAAAAAADPALAFADAFLAAVAGVGARASVTTAGDVDADEGVRARGAPRRRTPGADGGAGEDPDVPGRASGEGGTGVPSSGMDGGPAAREQQPDDAPSGRRGPRGFVQREVLPLTSEPAPARGVDGGPLPPFRSTGTLGRCSYLVEGLAAEAEEAGVAVDPWKVRAPACLPGVWLCLCLWACVWCGMWWGVPFTLCGLCGGGQAGCAATAG